MWLCKCVRSNDKRRSKRVRLVDDEEDRREEERDGYTEEELDTYDGVKLVYFACTTPNQDVINTLNSLIRATIETFTSENECVEYLTPITNKVFLIIDGSPSVTLLELIEPLKQIDSLFVYSSSDSNAVVSQKQHTYFVNWCDNEEALINNIKTAREELDRHISAFTMFNQKEKTIRDLSKEAGSFLFLQLFKSVLKNLPKTAEAKKTMVTICRIYYRGNLSELANIDDFDKTYKSIDAIPWYTRDTFINKLIIKAIRTDDIDVLYRFRFYIMDLSEQLELEGLKLRKKQKDVLKLYRSLKLSSDEIAFFQRSVGNLISTNGYLSTSSNRAVAFEFATKSANREDVVRALFEYQVDLKVVQNIVVADISQYSAFPEEAEILIDIGAVFQIDHCQYNTDEDLWHIQVHATDQGANLNAEYMEYQKKKIAESSTILMFGNLLLEMGEYAKAERYFDTILNSSNPNDEEIACIFFNFGRVHRLKGDFNRAIVCYDRAYRFHLNAKPKRLASAGKSLNDLGVVYSEQGKKLKAEECFIRVMKLYKKSLSKKHINVAETLINLGIIDCDRQDYDRALSKFLEATKIYDDSLPSTHPNQALLRVNIGNVYLAAGDYEKAFEEYENALKIQEQSLPRDHQDIVRTLHNLAAVQAQRGKIEQAKEYLERAEETASRTLPSKHPIMTLLDKTKKFLVEEV